MSTYTKYETDALTNNTFDMGSLNETLKELKETSFGFLYGLQKEISGIKRSNHTMQEFYMLNRYEYELSVPMEFIDLSRRKIFRNSQYYEKWLSIDTITTDTNIFTSSFLLIINGMQYTNVSIKCYDGRTLIKLPLKKKSDKTGLDKELFTQWYSNNVNVVIVFVPNLKITTSGTFSKLPSLPTYYKSIDIKTVDRYFQLEPEAMPFPTESMMIFRKTDTGLTFAHDVSLKLYYPNIYEIVCPNEYDLLIYVFYKEDVNTNYQYKNELSLYYKNSSSILSKYKDGTIPEIIKNYSPQEFIYGARDYEKNYYGILSEMGYKNTRFKEWIVENNEVVTPYLTRQILMNKRFFIHTNKIDLSKRIRHNNFNEVEYDEDREIFDEPRYLFVVSGVYTTDYMNLRFFIDGRFFAPDKMCRDEKYQYFYVPEYYITSDSVIEIERFYNYEFHEDVTYTVNDTSKEINVSSNTMNVYANDIFLTTKDTTYIDKNDFDITVGIGGIDIQLDDDSFCNISRADIDIIKSKWYDIPLDIWIKKISYYSVTKTVTVADKIANIIFEKDTSNDTRFFRIFRNGYLLPVHLYNIDFTNKMNERTAVALNMIREIGDIYTVDATPNKYKRILYSKTIDEKGYIDLTGVITRPISTLWYDIYINGRKLSDDNIDIITANKFFIKDVTSRKNLEIYEKDRDSEYFYIGSNSSSQTIIDSITGFFSEIYSKHGVLQDTDDDIIRELWDTLDLDVMNFYYLYMNMFINPDEDQITEEMIERFPTIFNGYPFFINPDIAPKALTVLELNGDESI